MPLPRQPTPRAEGWVCHPGNLSAHSATGVLARILHQGALGFCLTDWFAEWFVADLVVLREAQSIACPRAILALVCSGTAGLALRSSVSDG